MEVVKTASIDVDKPHEGIKLSTYIPHIAAIASAVLLESVGWQLGTLQHLGEALRNLMHPK